MAYVPGFEWDIFLSYPMEAEDWTNQFEKNLRDGTTLAAAKDLQIYFAQRNWQLGQISDQMLKAARSSALFVAVLTKDSLSENETRFLQKEMQAFRDANPLSSFCPIALHPIPASQLSRAMPIRESDAFWKTNEFHFEHGGGRLWLEPDIEPKPGDYKRAVKTVAYHLRERLDEIIRKGSPKAAGGKGAFSAIIVYLARTETRSYVESEWHDIRKMLMNDGVTVVPNDRSDNDATSLESAHLFVQLFSEVDSLEIPKAQLKLVEGSKSVSVVQWRKKPPNANLTIPDKENKEFCEGEHVQTGLFEEFKVRLRERLQEIKKELEDRAKRPPRILDAKKPYLYIAADTLDMTYARQLQDAALERAVADVMVDDEAQRRHDFEEGIKYASAVIFLYGNAKRLFVDLWLKEFVRKIQPAEPESKLTALYLAPPEKTKEDEQPFVPFKGLRTLGSQKKFTPQDINGIFAELSGDSVR